MVVTNSVAKIKQKFLIFFIKLLFFVSILPFFEKMYNEHTLFLAGRAFF